MVHNARAQGGIGGVAVLTLTPYKWRDECSGLSRSEPTKARQVVLAAFTVAASSSRGVRASAGLSSASANTRELLLCMFTRSGVLERRESWRWYMYWYAEIIPVGILLLCIFYFIFYYVYFIMYI